MGTVASREASPTMPGSLSMDSTPTLVGSGRFSTPFTENDDGVAPDVMTLELAQEDQHNHSEQSQAGSRLKSQSPGFISLAGLRTPFHPPSNLPTARDLPTPPFVTAQPGDFSTPSSSGPSTPLTPDNTPSIHIPTTMTAVHFHSPSSQIVGTPFATNSAPFEYPFPAPQASSSSNMSHFPSPASSSLSVTAAPPSPSLLPAAALPNATLSIPLNFNFPPNTQLYLTHPKLRTSPPPIPPSLLKKRKDKLQSQARRSTVDVSSSLNGHEPVHHTLSDSNLKARTRRSTNGGHGIRP